MTVSQLTAGPVLEPAGQPYVRATKLTEWNFARSISKSLFVGDTVE